ncbi:MAG: hypothetical protein JNG84_04200 [Archangium sp.]|nr:hypothetical protein [Archangium sp.]
MTRAAFGLETRPFVLLALVLLAGCSSATGSTAGRVSGPHDIALTDDYLFITSADSNELRVLRLTVPGSSFRGFVRAPNPLEPLSIPTIDRPTQLAQDERWVDGRAGQGSYVFASRPGSAEISVVGTTPESFREVRRLVLPSPVTATAAVQVNGDGRSRLYAAVLDGARAVLFAADLPTSAAELHAFDVQAALRVLTPFDGESIVTMLIVPALAGRTVDGRPFCDDAAQPCLVLATRRLGGGSGRTVMLEPSTLRAVPLAFPGPVRVLATHGQSVALDANGENQLVLRAGQRVVAVLDEEACGGPGCTGVVAVETVSAQSAEGFAPLVDTEGRPVPPLTFGGAPPVGITIGVNRSMRSEDGGATLYLPSTVDGTTLARPVSALGVATVADGTVTFFDATTMKQLDAADSLPRVENVRFELDGGALPLVSGPLIDASVRIADGVWSSETIAVEWRGALTDGPVQVSSSTTTFAVPESVAARVAPGDVARFEACGDASVTAVATGSITVDALPPGCTPTAFAIAAGGAAPMVVRRSTTPTYLGRASSGGRFRWNPPGAVASAPALELYFGTETDIAPPQAGARWLFDVIDDASPFALSLDLTQTSCGAVSVRQLPGRPLLDELRGRLFIAYPSVNGVADLNPAIAFRGSIDANSGVTCYR